MFLRIGGSTANRESMRTTNAEPRCGYRTRNNKRYLLRGENGHWVIQHFAWGAKHSAHLSCRLSLPHRAQTLLMIPKIKRKRKHRSMTIFRNPILHDRSRISDSFILADLKLFRMFSLCASVCIFLAFATDMCSNSMSSMGIQVDLASSSVWSSEVVTACSS